MREDLSVAATAGEEEQPLRLPSSARWHSGLRQLGSAVLMLVVALVIYAWPTSFGGRSTIVFVSGTSMLPTLSTDDVVLAREHVRYAVGDLIVFRIPDGTIGAEMDTAGDAYVIHRIVGGSETTGWVTQGDNRNSVDPWFLSDDDIVGRAERKAAIGPAALVAVRMTLTPMVWAAVAMLVAFVVSYHRLARADGHGADD